MVTVGTIASTNTVGKLVVGIVSTASLPLASCIVAPPRLTTPVERSIPLVSSLPAITG